MKNTIDLNMPWYDGKKKMEIRDDRKNDEEEHAYGKYREEEERRGKKSW